MQKVFIFIQTINELQSNKIKKVAGKLTNKAYMINVRNINNWLKIKKTRCDDENVIICIKAV